MRLSHCNRCGCEVRKVSLVTNGILSRREPRFCSRCGNALSSSPLVPGMDISQHEKELSLYEVSDLEKIITGILPEGYKDLLPAQLEKYIVRAISNRIRGIDPLPDRDMNQMLAGYEREMQLAVERDDPPGFIVQAPRSAIDETLSHLVRKYHLVWVTGIVRRSHLNLTPAEADDLRRSVAPAYYLVMPCDCDKATYAPDETHPNFMRKV